MRRLAGECRTLKFNPSDLLGISLCEYEGQYPTANIFTSKPAFVSG